MNKPYKEGVTLYEIIIDGWSRGFRKEQTIQEARAMGFELTYGELTKAWGELDGV